MVELVQRVSRAKGNRMGRVSGRVGSRLGREYEVMTLAGTPPLRFLQRTGGSDRAQDIEHCGIRGDLQVEIKRAVNQDPDAAEQGGNGERAVDTFGPVVEFGPGVAESEHKKPDGDSEPGEPGFGQELQHQAQVFRPTRWKNLDCFIDWTGGVSWARASPGCCRQQ